MTPLLEAAGQRVLAPDLLGLGADQTRAREVTLRAWVDQIGELVNAQPAPVVLAGHSRGGIVISEVAEALPEKIAALIYLCAFLPRDGEALIHLAQTDEQSRILPNLIVDEHEGYHTVRAEAVPEIFTERRRQPPRSGPWRDCGRSRMPPPSRRCT